MSMKANILLLVAIVSLPALAAPLATLLSKADAIVIGTESSLVETGKTVTFYLNVDRVFRGEIGVGATVNVVWNPRFGSGLPDGSPSYRGIWFLRKTEGGKWECLPAGSSGNAEFFPELSLPVSNAPLPEELRYDASTTALADQIILETAAGSPRPNRRMILNVIADLKSPAILRAFRQLAKSPDDDQALLGIIGLIESGDPSGLLFAEEKAARLRIGTPGADLVASTIKLQFRNPDPIGIAALGRMATSASASPLIQETSAQALAAIHTATAVTWLGGLLRSPTASMQVYGAQGLSFFVNGVGIPTPETTPTLDHLNRRQPSAYRTAETDQNLGYKPGQAEQFVKYWQLWWESHPELHSSTPQ